SSALRRAPPAYFRVESTTRAFCATAGEACSSAEDCARRAPSVLARSAAHTSANSWQWSLAANSSPRLALPAPWIAASWPSRCHRQQSPQSWPPAFVAILPNDGPNCDRLPKQGRITKKALQFLQGFSTGGDGGIRTLDTGISRMLP